MARRVLAVLLLGMAAGQASDLGGFVDIISTYRVGGGPVAAILAVGLVAAETAAGLGLLARGSARRSAAAATAAVVAVVWTGLAAQAFGRGLAIDNCGCFGVHLGQELRWWVLLEDVELVLLGLWVRRQTAAGPKGSPAPARAMAETALG